MVQHKVECLSLFDLAHIGVQLSGLCCLLGAVSANICLIFRQDFSQRNIFFGSVCASREDYIPWRGVYRRAENRIGWYRSSPLCFRCFCDANPNGRNQKTYILPKKKICLLDDLIKNSLYIYFCLFYILLLYLLKLSLISGLLAKKGPGIRQLRRTNI